MTNGPVKKGVYRAGYDAGVGATQDLGVLELCAVEEVSCDGKNMNVARFMETTAGSGSS